ncbi:hypothetical protein CONPUDRAFT_154879 [Coniophora puteana RWD-64-598 SS2]|uniref:MYND-type domain-containing protein n=1 Tax=Coniophora puteana (strain RWD-64-598) TaxID=741705 RepID=A0A5M3MKW8_CONPW|nr:uncharacterized protein CONPUDRAFT_154879 [Coniophora puteana RWD-64-598 SS2]EIW79464.1 hypothetical protein CONPUDRAFT_154879 [Coniophora puteana RWD-64-598 SS2]
MRRCSGGTGELLRCSGCLLHTYCSKECQKATWPLHKLECRTLWGLARTRAGQISGNPNAWGEFTRWAEYHQTSLSNFSINGYIQYGPGSDEHYVFGIYLRYQKNHAELPLEKKFKLVGVHPLDKDDIPPGDMVAMTVQRMYWTHREQLIPLGHMQFGDEYGGTGAYVLSVDFNPNTRVDLGEMANAILYPVKPVPFDKMRAEAHPAPRPYQTLERILAAGERLKFCCGKVPGMPKCCCGGWTHHDVDVDDID